MSSGSLRRAFQTFGERIGATFDLAGGVKKLHPFYERHPEAFPHRSVGEVIRALEWPKELAPSPGKYEYPRAANPGWHNHVQGVAHSETHWFISRPQTLYRVPLDWDLASATVDGMQPRPQTLVDTDGEHYGDPDWFEGHLYVPIEGKAATTPGRIGLFNAELQMLATAVLSTGWDAPWCAINPCNGLLYTSSYNASGLEVFRRVFGRHIPTDSAGHVDFRLEHLGTFKLYEPHGNEIQMSRIQGAAFSPRGHLYLVSWEQHAGVIAFDMITGRRVLQFRVDYRGDEVVEGMTVRDLDDGPAPGIAGQIHVLMFDWNPVNDDVYFKHYGVTDPEDRTKL